jgi:PAS domain S-box-containing protein
MLYAIHVIAHILIILFLLGITYWVRQSSEGKAARWMVAVLGIDLMWAASLLLTLLVPVDIKKLLYPIVTSLGTVTTLPWLVFTLYYTGRAEWLTRTRWVGLVGLTVVATLATATNRVHGLVYSDLDVLQEPFAHVLGQPTALQLAISVVPITFSFVGILILTDFILSTKHLSRAQSLAIVGGAASAVGFNMVWFLELGPARGFNYSGIGVGIFGIALGWALFNDDLFRVAPVARDSVFASFSDPLVTLDMSGTVVDFNQSSTDVFPAIQSHLGDSMHEMEPNLFDADDASEVRMRQREDIIPDSFETTVDGDERSFRLNTSGIEGGNKQVGIVLHFRDITELERRTEELERRTNQLETKSQQLEQFASSVSHDLRNPINVAKGRIDLTKETGDTEHLDAAEEAMDRGLETIEELLDLAKSGQTIGDPTVFELADTVEDAWQTVDTKATRLDTNLGEWTIRADKGRVQGLLENLFRNSIEHGSTDLTVTVARTEDGFFVADDGPGIPEDEQDKIFDHGYTGGGGTGLGLAKVEAIAVAHDWTVDVAESEGGGAKFVFRNVTDGDPTER